MLNVLLERVWLSPSFVGGHTLHRMGIPCFVYAADVKDTKQSAKSYLQAEGAAVVEKQSSSP